MFKLKMTGLVLLLVVQIVTEVALASDTESNKALVRRFVVATNELDFATLDKILAPDVIRHSQSTPDMQITNLDDFKAYIKQDAANFKGARVDVDMFVAEANRVALHGVFSGIHVGLFGPIEATGKPVSINISGIFRIQDDRIAEFWVVWDNLAMLTQIGHSPFESPASK